MHVELKIKLKSLAEEARIIRREELIAKKRGDYSTLNSLHNHRVLVVRPAARSTHLAYSFLRGRNYRDVERMCYHQPNFAEVFRMVKKYGGWAQKEDDLKGWFATALQKAA
jgi:hypothetical protein